LQFSRQNLHFPKSSHQQTAKMPFFDFLNPILTPTAQAAVAADQSIAVVLLVVIFGLVLFGVGAWYIGFATGKGKILREAAKKEKAEKKANGGKAPAKGARR
jgi:hypothetical protein